MWPFERKCVCKAETERVMEESHGMKSESERNDGGELVLDPFTWTPREYQRIFYVGWIGICEDFWYDQLNDVRNNLGIYPTKKMAENALGIAREAIRKHYSNQPKP